MSWHQIGELARCKGFPLLGYRADGRPRRRRCRTALHVGSWFWLEGKLPYCEACALDDDQPINAHPRGTAPPTAEQRAQRSYRDATGAGTGSARTYTSRHAVDRWHQTKLDGF